MRTVFVLLVLIIAGQATAAETRASGDEQPAWLVAYECFQQAGDLIVAGRYETARQLLLETSAKMRQPYQLRAQSAARRLPLTGPDDDNLVHMEQYKVQLTDPLGRSAARDSKFDARSAHDLNWMAEVCSDIEAYNAALTLEQRSFDRNRSPRTAGEIVKLLYWTHGHPDEAEGIIKLSGDASLREQWRATLNCWRERHQHMADPLARLGFWHGEAPLARLVELELLRPLLVTRDQRIEFESERVAALARIGDIESRDESMEDIFAIAKDRPELCAELLWKAAQLAQRNANAHRSARYLQRIADNYSETARAGRAIQNLSIGARLARDDRELIRLIELLFEWADLNRQFVNGKDRSYRVDLHQAAIDLSQAHEALGSHHLALQYARMARDEYPSHSDCGTGLIEGRTWLQRRISQLEARAASLELQGGDLSPFQIPQF